MSVSEEQLFAEIEADLFPTEVGTRHHKVGDAAVSRQVGIEKVEAPTTLTRLESEPYYSDEPHEYTPLER